MVGAHDNLRDRFPALRRLRTTVLERGGSHEPLRSLINGCTSDAARASLTQVVFSPTDMLTRTSQIDLEAEVTPRLMALSSQVTIPRSSVKTLLQSVTTYKNFEHTEL